MRYRLWRSGKMLDLSGAPKLGEGGEARVFCVTTLGMAAKVYHRPDPRYVAKLKAMLENPPVDPTSGQGHVSIAWPHDLLLHPDGSFHGYVMPLVRGVHPLVSFYVPKLRRQQRPLFNYLYLVTAALNVTTAVRALHERNYVIGDVNESNILLADTALATVVDTDSFQVIDAATGTVHRCPVGKPEFTPPELHGKSFSELHRMREHDSFGLAVILFQLLMEGTHPFDGIYAAPGEPPSIDERIAAGDFPHGDRARGVNRPKPTAPPFGMLEPGLQRLFVQCFVEGHGYPPARPDAAAWRTALAQAAQLLRTCALNDQHRHWGHVECPWCERARRLGGVDPFPSAQAVKRGEHMLQRSAGAQTPSHAPMPIPTRTAPACVATPPTRTRAAARLLRQPARWTHWAAGFAPLVLVVLWDIFANGPSRVNTPQAPASPTAESVAPKIEFVDSPQPGKSFHALAGINMVWIGPGCFQMGDSTGKGSSDAKPSHQVRLTTGYWLAESDVTQRQWRAVMGNNPSYFKGESLPVENVSWNDAAEFCRKMTESERARGRLPAGMEYRLPTEAQWEYACRAGTVGDYAGDLDAMGWYRSNSGQRTHEVKTKRPNAWGLYDMHGNVWQWCSDWYGSYEAKSQIDPTGPSTGSYRMYRGGSWYDTDSHCQSAFRFMYSPNYRGAYVGIRLAAVASSGSVTATATTSAGSEAASDELRAEVEPAPMKIEFVDSPEVGKSFRALAGINMVWIVAGRFQMGDATGKGDADERPVHEVRLSTGYWLGESDVTQQQWTAVMGSNPSYFKGESLPVENVSWNDAVEFCRKVTESERARGLLPGIEYRLPTEAQWEYACRAGTFGDYTGGLDAMAWYASNSGQRTHEVKAKHPNAWGLYDMHGNVWQWCSDWFGSYEARSLVDPTGPSSGSYRVRRGGSWNITGSYCRSTYRNGFAPDYRYDSVGFRLAAVPSSGL